MVYRRKRFTDERQPDLFPQPPNAEDAHNSMAASKGGEKTQEEQARRTVETPSGNITITKKPDGGVTVEGLHPSDDPFESIGYEPRGRGRRK